jgi:Spy/CpxP family protein refolding chaperone
LKIANKSLLSGLVVVALVAIGGLAVQAHEGHPHAEGMRGGNRLSITGSPEELSQRAHELGEHICATIKAATDCPVTPISDKAANDLGAMQASYAQGLTQMHKSLTAASFDRAEFDRIQSSQAKAIETSATRYLLFLADAAASLTPEQRQMFSPNAHAEH